MLIIKAVIPCDVSYRSRPPPPPPPPLRCRRTTAASGGGPPAGGGRCRFHMASMPGTRPVSGIWRHLARPRTGGWDHLKCHRRSI